MALPSLSSGSGLPYNVQIPTTLGNSRLSPTLRAFLGGWQPRQRRTLGMLNALVTRLQAVTGGPGTQRRRK